MLRLSGLILGLAVACHGIAIPQEAQNEDKPQFVGAVILGSCPEFTTMKDFNISAYTGRWFEIQKFSTLFEIGQKCIKADYSTLTSDSIKVVNSGQYESTGKPFGIIGNATATDISGHFDLYFPFPASKGDYNVLHTDYENYTTIYSCGSPVPGLTIQYAWILSRQATLSPELLAEAMKVFDGFKIDVAKLEKTIQDDTCDYSCQDDSCMYV